MLAWTLMIIGLLIVFNDQLADLCWRGADACRRLSCRLRKHDRQGRPMCKECTNDRWKARRGSW